MRLRRPKAHQRHKWHLRYGERGLWRWVIWYKVGHRSSRMSWWLGDVKLRYPCEVWFEWEAKMAKRLSASDVVQLELQGPTSGPDAQKVFPNLSSWICDAAYEDGSRKGKTRVQVERRGSRVVVVLKDQDSGHCVEAAHESLQDALMTMELLLGHPDCPWTLDPFPMAKPKGSRKK